MITKGLKGAWQFFGFTLQNKGTKCFIASDSFAPVLISQRTFSLNIQPVFTVKLFLLNLFTDQFFHFQSNKMTALFWHGIPYRLQGKQDSCQHSSIKD